MFGILFTLAQLSISIVYPLHESYKSIIRAKDNSEDITKWLIYWIVLALMINFENFVHPVTRYIPFIGLIKIYLSTWLVFPVLDRLDYKLHKSKMGGKGDDKVNGAIMLWEFYMIPLLANFDTKFTNFFTFNGANLKKVAVKVYNLVIDSAFKGNPKLKVFGSTEPRQDSEDSFVGSVYVILKESTFLSMPKSVETNPELPSELNGPVTPNKNLALLKSLVSLFPIRSDPKEASQTASKSSLLDSNEEFDVVEDKDLIPENDSDGSVTSTGWFRWRNVKNEAELSPDSN